jgi:glutamate carboxypeptidase
VIDFMQYFETRTEEMVDLLTRFAEIESPSSDKAATDRMGEAIAEVCSALGAAVHTESRDAVGDLRLVKWNADAPGKPLLMLAHIDTVWPLGTLATMPVHREDDRLYGPGTVDMKGGTVVFLSAIKGLQAQGLMPDRPVWALFTTDEETGSEHSVEYIRATAKQAGLVLVTEAPTPPDKLKTARKATATFTITAVGKASHAGAAPQNGVNAVAEIAHQINAVQAIGHRANGTTVTPTVVEGGGATNVVPALAQVIVDARAATLAEVKRIEREIQALEPVLPGAALQIIGGFDRPPMERSALIVETFQQAARIAQQIGHPPLEESSTGGGSDGNYTAALGVPTLDGLGAPGGGAHAAHEHVHIPGLAQRAALIAGLLVHWPRL